MFFSTSFFPRVREPCMNLSRPMFYVSVHFFRKITLLSFNVNMPANLDICSSTENCRSVYNDSISSI